VADVKSDSNEFLESFTVSDVAKRVLEMTNIVLPRELICLARPYDQPGTYALPLALLDEEGQQVSISVQLTPRQVSNQELIKLRPDRAGTDGDPAPS
jgi:hypothetical protein